MRSRSSPSPPTPESCPVAAGSVRGTPPGCPAPAVWGGGPPRVGGGAGGTRGPAPFLRRDAPLVRQIVGSKPSPGAGLPRWERGRCTPQVPPRADLAGSRPDGLSGGPPLPPPAPLRCGGLARPAHPPHRPSQARDSGRSWHRLVPRRPRLALSLPSKKHPVLRGGKRGTGRRSPRPPNSLPLRQWRPRSGRPAPRQTGDRPGAPRRWAGRLLTQAPCGPACSRLTAQGSPPARCARPCALRPGLTKRPNRHD